jgi:hypothetical protein
MEYSEVFLLEATAVGDYFSEFNSAINGYSQKTYF